MLKKIALSSSGKIRKFILIFISLLVVFYFGIHAYISFKLRQENEKLIPKLANESGFTVYALNKESGLKFYAPGYGGEDGIISVDLSYQKDGKVVVQLSTHKPGMTKDEELNWLITEVINFVETNKEKDLNKISELIIEGKWQKTPLTMGREKVQAKFLISQKPRFELLYITTQKGERICLVTSGWSREEILKLATFIAPLTNNSKLIKSHTEEFIETSNKL